MTQILCPVGPAAVTTGDTGARADAALRALVDSESAAWTGSAHTSYLKQREGDLLAAVALGISITGADDALRRYHAARTAALLALQGEVPGGPPGGGGPWGGGTVWPPTTLPFGPGGS